MGWAVAAVAASGEATPVAGTAVGKVCCSSDIEIESVGSIGSSIKRWRWDEESVEGGAKAGLGEADDEDCADDEKRREGQLCNICHRPKIKPQS